MVVPHLAVEEAKAENAEKMQPHDDDQDAGDLRQHAEVLEQQVANPGGRGAKRNEHRGKTHHEHGC